MDIADEVEALNSIYGDESLVPVDGGTHTYALRLPQSAVRLRVQFPDDYPDAPPAVLGIESAGGSQRNGEAARLLALVQQTVGKVFTPGQACLFDVIEEVATQRGDDALAAADAHLATAAVPAPAAESTSPVAAADAPPWVVSAVISELKSVFVARAARVGSPEQALGYVQHLLDTDKKVAKATHNITAWRIRGSQGSSFQDCDDDGETAAGGRLLHLMQLTDVWDVMVVVTRWYGGQKLGPARFGLINAAARDALVKGGFIRAEGSKKKKR